MEEFDWSGPEINVNDELERWIDIEDPELAEPARELDEAAADVIVQDFEFDIQPRLLRKKEKKEPEFFVEYDKLTNEILEITPEVKEKSSTIRHGIFSTKQTDIINRIFEGKIPLSKLHVKHNRNRTKEITLGPVNKIFSEFDYRFAPYDTTPAPIHIFCNPVLKKVTVNLDYQKMKYYLSMDNLTESKLERNNGHFSIFCIDKLDRTRLYDNIHINIFELCNIQQIEKQCFWLPDNPNNFGRIGFVYHNNELPITFSLENEYTTQRFDDVCERPQLIYKQVDNKLLLQSIMKDTNNFKINEEIIFYIFSKHDPTRLIEYKKLNRSVFNDFSLFEMELNYNEPVRLTTDHLHLHLEDSNVSTYYRI